jgi:hypothetical protein
VENAQTEQEAHARDLLQAGYLVAYDQILRGRFADARSVLVAVTDALGRLVTESAAA